jgi:hypothetical protein
MNINLFTGWHYEPKNKIREQEFDFCYNKNKVLKFNNYFIDKTKRPAYNTFFNEMKKYPNDINIIANPDNFFDEKFLNDLLELYTNYPNKEKLCLGLTRWNYHDENNIVFFNAKDSQDIFIFYGSIDFENYEYITMGTPGCDNRIAAHLIHDFKLDVYNPSKDLKYYHYHPSDDATRTYLNERGERKEMIHGPYEFIYPCNLIDLKK